MAWVRIDEKDASLLLASGAAISDKLREDLENIGEPRDPRELQIIELVETRDGETECDPDAVVSEGDDNGAYVMTWSWVDFSGTPLDKDIEPEEEDEAA
jgi:hypothetical protein